MDVRALRSQAHHLDPIMHIGKAGMTQGVVAQLKDELAARHLVKVKLLPAALPDEPTKAHRHGLAQLLAEATGATLVSVVGSVVTLYKR
jgi:RNA-binding protein